MTSQRMRTLTKIKKYLIPEKLAHRKLWKIYGNFPAQRPSRCLLDTSGVCMQKQSPVLTELLFRNFATFWIIVGLCSALELFLERHKKMLT